ncbi:uncharacterized protein LOC18446060 isoform X4 [Amborella trichopoda]|uniref:uncharacterized protein LOC18446060 isoform X4 n=1 Tax=Amborella trichopoda TaxID=13333 RepID=UPI0005D2F674|nr:uncharacterized protein LOC18446060 isoform X4 [Amborella trichopoda]|eukprot:XP_011627748.1 uncharacterized protein LOC18446060 isoform X4 [Amborella trichopoda]
MCSSDLSWLCNLFKDSITELTDCGPIILTEEREMDTLIRLSQGVLMNVVCEDKSDRTFQASSPMGHDCLNIIMPTLVVFLTFASQFVRHSAGKVFVVLSNFLGKYIRYDHLLLLDYLISKDIGVLCLQYLLRCLRLVCNSWPIFKGFSMPNHEMNRLCCKRRTVSVDGRDFVGKVQPLSSSVEGISATQPPRTGHKKRKGKTSGESTFENAEECLLSLKYALENLPKKNLFPYNPTALLRSFTRFQKFCSNKERESIDYKT